MERKNRETEVEKERKKRKEMCQRNGKRGIEREIVKERG